MAAEKEPEKNQQKNNYKLLFVAACLLLVIVALAFIFNPTALNQNTPQEVQQIPATPPLLNEITENSSANDLDSYESDVINPADFPVREDYFKEVFRPRRQTYKLFEKAGKFLNKDQEGVKQYFGLENEEEIFEELPAVPDDFSELAYLLGSGRYYAVGELEEPYFLQPELYWNFKSLGVRYWTQPDPQYWVTNGYGSYPSDQFDSLKIGEREEFTGAVFVYSGWGVQTYQGMSLEADPESKKYFDIEITPKNNLLGPAWPKFSSNWAYKVIISGKLKEGVPAGNYKIGINPVTPPQELTDQWEFEHKNVYFNAAGSIKPSGNFIEFNIDVTE